MPPPNWVPPSTPSPTPPPRSPASPDEAGVIDLTTPVGGAEPMPYTPRQLDPQGPIQIVSLERARPGATPVAGSIQPESPTDGSTIRSRGGRAMFEDHKVEAVEVNIQVPDKEPSASEGAAAMRLGRSVTPGQNQQLDIGQAGGRGGLRLTTMSSFALISAVGVGPVWHAHNAWATDRDPMVAGAILAGGGVVIGGALGLCHLVHRLSKRPAEHAQSLANATFTIMMMLSVGGSLMAGAMHEAGVWTNWSKLLAPRAATAHDLASEPAPQGTGEGRATRDEDAEAGLAVPSDQAASRGAGTAQPGSEPLDADGVGARATLDQLLALGVVNAGQLMDAAVRAGQQGGAGPEASRRALSEELTPLVGELQRATGAHREAFQSLRDGQRDYSREGLETRLVLIREAHRANAQLEEVYLALPGALADALGSQGMDQTSASKLAHAAFPDDRLSKVTELRLVQRELCAALEEEARALLQAWGEWTLEADEAKGVRFRSIEAGKRYARAQRLVQTQVVKHDGLIAHIKDAMERD